MFHLSIYFGKNIIVYYCEDKYIHIMIIYVHDASYQIVLYHWSQISTCCFSSLKSSNPNKCNWACQVGQHKHYQYHWPPSPTAGEPSWKKKFGGTIFQRMVRWSFKRQSDILKICTCHKSSCSKYRSKFDIRKFQLINIFQQKYSTCWTRHQIYYRKFQPHQNNHIDHSIWLGGRTCKQFGNAVYPVGNVKRMVLRRKKPAAISVSSLEVLAGWVKTNW